MGKSGGLPEGYVLSEDDGLPARDQGDWAQQKLQFLDNYQGPALGATKKKGEHVYYLDLFAGPGRNVSVTDGRRIEYPGSPVRALRAAWRGRDEVERRFHGFYFCNLAEIDHRALQARVVRVLTQLGGAVPSDSVHCILGDANAELAGVLAAIPSFAYVLAFADIEGPGDLPFATLARLKRVHTSVDLYVLYPSDIGMDRLLAYSDARTAPYAGTLNAYFGTDEWQGIWRARTTNAQSREMKLALLNLYRSQLLQHWQQVEEVATVRKRQRVLYKMLFASDHPAAWAIARSAGTKSEQMDLGVGL